MGKMEDSSTVRVLLDQITEGQLQWASLDDDYDVAVLGEPDQVLQYLHFIKLSINDKEEVIGPYHLK